MNDQQLATRPEGAFQISSFEDMQTAAQAVAKSGMFGITMPEQAICLFMICQAEGINPVAALRRYHLIEGRPAMRADAMQGEFFARGGGIVWIVRSRDMASATFFRDAKKIDDAARKRGADRFKLLWALEFEQDPPKRGEIMGKLAALSNEGEETILRTFAGFEESGITQGKSGLKANWRAFPAEMLTARVASAGIRVVDPGLIAGIYSPDELEDATLTLPEGEKRAGGAPGASDRAAMEAMIEEYHRQAKETKSPARKSELLGLASDLRLKIEEMDDAIDMTPVKVEELPGLEEVKTVSSQPVSQPELLGVEARVKWQDYVLTQTKSKTLQGRRLGDFSKEEIEVIFPKCIKGLTSEDARVRIEAGYIKEAFESWEDVK